MRTTLRRELRMLSRFGWSLAAGVLMGSLAIGSSVGLMAVSAYLISRAALISNVADVALAITAVRVLAISRAAFRYLERYVTHRATFRFLAHLRGWFFGAIEPLAPARLEGYQSGDLLGRIVADVDRLEDLPVRVVIPPLVAVIVTLFTVALLGAFDMALGLVLLGFLLLTGVVIPMLMRSAARRPTSDLVSARAELHPLLVDLVQGASDLLAFDQAGRHRQRVLAAGHRHDRAAQRLGRLSAVTTGLGVLATGLCAVALLGIAVPLVSGGDLDGVFLALVPLAAVASFEAVQPMAAALELGDATTISARRLFELVDARPAVSEPSGRAAAGSEPARPALAPPEPARPERLDIEIRDLSFDYGVGGPAVIQGLDLRIPAGTSLALLGPSGAGKSTLIDLLLRFREYPAGTIRVGGRELRDCGSDEIRALMGVVPQRIHVFNGTIRDNVAVADGSATDEAIEVACRTARLHERIESLPMGYRTLVGEDGVQLSGGERQRLAIARAILKGAPILILDEATANLDEATEAAVMEALTEFATARTTLIVTHRVEVAARADAVQWLPVHGDPLLASHGVDASPARAVEART